MEGVAHALLNCGSTTLHIKFFLSELKFFDFDCIFVFLVIAKAKASQMSRLIYKKNNQLNNSSINFD